MNIALTGSTGLLGSSLYIDLKRAGHNLIRISSSCSNPSDMIFSYDQAINNDSNHKVDYIIHLASINSNLKKTQIENEVNLSRDVLRCMESLGCTKIIFFSSIKVYGGNTFENEIYTECSSLNPECYYGFAKKRVEKFLIQESLKSKFDFIILRLPPVLLENTNSNLGKLFFAAKKGLPIPSFKIGEHNERSYLSYNYLLSTIEIFLGNKGTIDNQIYNLADSSYISTNDLIRKIYKKIGKKPKIFYLPNFIFKLMMKINILQSLLLRIFGSFKLSTKKLNEELLKI